MEIIFISATGTEIGKTYITSKYISSLRKRGKKIAALKPVITGLDLTDPENYKASDAAILLQALGEEITINNIKKISPFQFQLAASPYAAAIAEGEELDYQELLDFTENYIKQNQHLDYLIIEGVGGVLSPLNSKKHNLDFANDLAANLYLIAGNYLGTISHTLTALKSIEQYLEIKLEKVIINNYPDSDLEILAANSKEIELFSNRKLEVFNEVV